MRQFGAYLAADYCRGPLRNAHSTGLKFGLRGHLPAAHCLREWWWGDPVEGDLSLYDKDGLALARLVLEGGRYHLRSPLPRLSWPNLELARRGAESFALCSLPLDPDLAARIKRYNTTPHPLGPPLNRLLLVTMPVVEAPPIAPDFEGDPLDIPEFLRRAS